jgi:hypothetical protein
VCRRRAIIVIIGVGNMPARNGVPTIQKRAKLLCDIMNKFAPIIVSQYPTNTALAAALAAAQAACAALDIEIEKVRLYGD